MEGNAWWFFSKEPPKVYGNIDFRQVALAFKDSERISEVLVQEGDKITKGQVLAKLETDRIVKQIAAQKASLEAAQAALDKLLNGTRPEEKAQAQAEVEAAEAELEYARKEYNRNQSLTTDTHGKAVSKQLLEQSESQLSVAEAQLNVKRKALELALIGPRKEDIDQQRALVLQAKEQLALLNVELDEHTLVSPVDGIIRRRLLEPGDMASASKAVFSVSVPNPIWARAYVSEPQLAEFTAGQKVDILCDVLPGTRIPATVGFISSTAEFTPKNIETEELRTSLVYEIRCYIENPPPELRLGMPVTVIPAEK